MAISIQFTAILIFASLVGTIQGQTECQCDANVLSQGSQEWFHTFDTLFYDTCVNATTCEQNCYDLIKTFTGDFDLHHKINGTQLGQWACQQLVHDVQQGSSILFQSQPCNLGWANVAQIDDFCCFDGKFPPQGCS